MRRVCKNRAAISQALADIVIEASTRAIANHGSFFLGLSGGSLPDLLAMSDACSSADKRWRVFLVDERMVPLDDPDSNYGAIMRKIPALKLTQSFPVDTGLSLTEAAKAYQETLLQEVTRLDLCLLGMGPDGHTASIFPGHPSFTTKTDSLVYGVEESPKPPPNRVTLSLDTINRSAAKVFVVMGAEKAPVLKTIAEGQGQAYPAGHISDALWLLDEAAAANVPA